MEIPVDNKIGLDRFISDVIISGQQMTGQHICFILGSGASVSSGIPTGGELEMDWMNHMMSQSDSYKTELRKLADGLYRAHKIDHAFADIEKSWQTAKGNGWKTLPSEYYFDLFVLRFHGIRNGGIRELQNRMSGREPSLGYCLLAQLMTRDNCRNNIVVTTNFDNLVEKAVYAFTEQAPVTVSHESLADSMSWQVRYPIVAKVHRDLMFSPLNSTGEIKALKEQWKEPLQDVLKGYVPVVIGYAGADDSLMSFLEDATFPNGLYWCYREDGVPSERVVRLVREKGGFLVPIKGFDELMVEISQYSGPDERVIDPAFLDGLEQRIGTRMRELRKKLEALKKKLGNEKPLTASDYFNRAYRRYLEGDTDGAIADYSKAIERKPDLAEAYNNRGNAYRKKGDYEAAIADYSKAIEIQPDDADAYYNRGNAYRKKGDTDGAIADYSKAIEIKPDLCRCLL